MVRGARAPAPAPSSPRMKATPVPESASTPDVPVIDEPTITAAVDDALAAISAASGTAELKQVRIAHVGDAGVLSRANRAIKDLPKDQKAAAGKLRSEEHTSELQSRGHLVCRLLLEKKNKI